MFWKDLSSFVIEVKISAVQLTVLAQMTPGPPERKRIKSLAPSSNYPQSNTSFSFHSLLISCSSSSFTLLTLKMLAKTVIAVSFAALAVAVPSGYVIIFISLRTSLTVFVTLIAATSAKPLSRIAARLFRKPATLIPTNCLASSVSSPMFKPLLESTALPYPLSVLAVVALSQFCCFCLISYLTIRVQVPDTRLLQQERVQGSYQPWLLASCHWYLNLSSILHRCFGFSFWVI